MRTTLAIADDVLAAAREIARKEGKSVGDVITNLARRSLTDVEMALDDGAIPQFPVTNSSAVVTLEIVNALRDELP